VEVDVDDNATGHRHVRHARRCDLAGSRQKGPPALAGLRYQSFEEGRSVRILHKGPFDAEGPTIQKLHQFIEDQGGHLSGKHHEIYLNDFRRTAPERLKTVLRQPFTL
jgi:hypothetical protein